MQNEELNALNIKIELLEVALKHLSVRADISLNIVSALTASLGGKKTNVYREIAIEQISKFNYEYNKSIEKILADEKAHILSRIESVAIPKYE